MSELTQWSDRLPPQSLRLITDDKIEVPFGELVKIDPDNLTQAYTTQAAWAGFFNYHSALANARVEKQQRNIKRIEAEKFQYYKGISQEGKKRPTVEDIKSAVASDKDLATQNEILDRLKIVALNWESAKWSWHDRKDMLMQMGADSRIERQT